MPARANEFPRKALQSAPWGGIQGYLIRSFVDHLRIRYSDEANYLVNFATSAMTYVSRVSDLTVIIGGPRVVYRTIGLCCFSRVLCIPDFWLTHTLCSGRREYTTESIQDEFCGNRLRITLFEKDASGALEYRD
jgi:hypothetical protein